MRIAVCDDSPEHLSHLSDLICQTLPQASCNLDCFSDSNVFLRRAEENGGAYDVAFLNVELGTRNGAVIANSLSRIAPGTQIVFVTSGSAYAADISDTAHVFFLVKPVRPEQLASALSHALELADTEQRVRVPVPLCGGTTRLLSASDVICCERAGRITILRCRSLELRTPLKIRELEELLPAGIFARPHNSFLVNLSAVVAVERYLLHLEGGLTVPVSNQRRVPFSAALAAFT